MSESEQSSLLRLTSLIAAALLTKGDGQTPADAE